VDLTLWSQIMRPLKLYSFIYSWYISRVQSQVVIIKLAVPFQKDAIWPNGLNYIFPWFLEEAPVVSLSNIS
jgi:hypothetical protein